MTPAKAVALFDPDAVDSGELEGLSLVGQATALVVEDQAGLVRASGFRQGVKALIAEIESTFGPLKKKAHDAHKAIVAEENRQLARPKEALELVNRAMGVYEGRQRREQQIAEARAAEAARHAGVDPGGPTVVPAAHVAPATVPGVSFASRWDVTVDDKMALIRAVATGWGSADVFDVDLGLLRDLVRVRKGAIEIPGCTITEDRRPRG